MLDLFTPDPGPGRLGRDPHHQYLGVPRERTAGHPTRDNLGTVRLVEALYAAMDSGRSMSVE